MSKEIRALPTWPIGQPLPVDAAFFFYDPTTDEEYRAVPEQVAGAPAPRTGTAVQDLQAGYGIRLDPLPTGKLLVTCTLQTTAAPLEPDAPGDGRVDDKGDNLNGTLVAGFLAVADYEAFGVPGFPGIVNLTLTGGDVQSGRVFSRGLTGPIDASGTGIRVAASGPRPAGRWMLNDRPFTGTTVVAPPAAVAPTLDAFTPLSGAVGTTVTLSGSGFGASQGAGTVRLNGALVSVASWSASSITFPVPAGATSGPITVTTTAGSATSTQIFTVLTGTASPSYTVAGYAVDGYFV